jgi:hypothetical protein
MGETGGFNTEMTLNATATQRVVGESPVIFLATVINNTNIDTTKLGNSANQT